MLAVSCAMVHASLRLLVVVASLGVPLAGSIASAESVPEPSMFAGGYVGAATGLAGGSDPYTLTVVGLRGGARVSPDGSVVASVGIGGLMYDDGYSQSDPRGWEMSAGYAHAFCTTPTRVVCALPTVAAGYQRGSYTYLDDLGEVAPFAETLTRLFVDGRVTGRLLVERHVAFSVALGVRISRSLHDSYRMGERTEHGLVAAAGIDVAW
jgi:hypothetical protein